MTNNNEMIQPAPNPNIPGIAATGLTRNQVDVLTIGRATNPAAGNTGVRVQRGVMTDMLWNYLDPNPEETTLAVINLQARMRKASEP